MSLTSLVDEEVIRTDQLFLRERLGPRVGEYVQRIAPNPNPVIRWLFS